MLGLMGFSGSLPLYVMASRRFVPKTFRSLERNVYGRFVLWTFRSLDVSFSRRFVPWTIRSLDVSFYGRFVLSSVCLINPRNPPPKVEIQQFLVKCIRNPLKRSVAKI